MLNRVILTALVLVLTVLNIHAQRVIDGDTFSHNGKRYRLYGIDAPEMDQPWGNDALHALKRVFERHDVSIEHVSEDNHGRILCTLTVIHPDYGEVDVNEALVRAGYAWSYSYYDTKYDNAQRQAKLVRVGIWGNDCIVNPYKWRKGERCD